MATPHNCRRTFFFVVQLHPCTSQTPASSCSLLNSCEHLHTSLSSVRFSRSGTSLGSYGLSVWKVAVIRLTSSQVRMRLHCAPGISSVPPSFDATIAKLSVSQYRYVPPA